MWLFSFFHFLFFHFISRFVSPLYFPVVVPRCSTPGGWVEVLEPVVGSKSSSQPLLGRSPWASRLYYFSLFFIVFQCLFIVFHCFSFFFHWFLIVFHSFFIDFSLFFIAFHSFFIVSNCFSCFSHCFSLLSWLLNDLQMFFIIVHGFWARCLLKWNKKS